MSETGYTPGPWELERHEVRSQARPDETFPMFNVLAPNPDAGKKNVCYSGSHFTICADLDGEADATLIAAAPELDSGLEALFTTVGEALIDGAIDHDHAVKISEAHLAAQSILAKARGRRVDGQAS